MKPVLLIYSNCQAYHMFNALRRINLLMAEIDIRYLFIHSLDEPGQGWDSYPTLSDVTWVWEQVSDAFPEHRAALHLRLPAGARRIKFPALTAGMIWPFASPDPRPIGHNPYLYGDNVAAAVGLQLGNRTASNAEIIEQYMELSCRRMPDLERRRELEYYTWRRRDLDSDVSVADFMIENIESVQLFYERGRLTQNPVRYILAKLLQATFGSRFLSAAEAMLRYYVGYDNISRPVHPVVAERLGLSWYDREATYRWFGHDLTFDEWIVRCVRLSPYVPRVY